MYQAAIEDCTAAIKLAPEKAAFYHTRGTVKASLGDLKGAIEDFDITIKNNPKDAIAYFDRGLAKEALGQHDAAKADFQKAKELDPDVEKKKGN